MPSLNACGHILRQRHKLYLWSAIATSAAWAPAHAQTVVSNAQGSKITLSGGDTLTVADSGSLSTGSSKAVTIKTPTAVSITVDSGGAISSQDDAITTKTIDTSVGTISIVNNGTITSTVSGQAINLDDVSAPGVTTTITNGETGRIIAANADGVRPGGNATVSNSGLIYADGASNDSHDGVDFQSYGGIVVNQSTGLISGQRHGITSDLNVNVTNYGTIIGRNGSGVGSDGTGTVYNYGTIIGAYNGSGTGDGDGVDIDGAFYIDNYGTIAAQGAAGVDKWGDINRSEGVALTGGGTLINEKGGVITSVDVGATLCCTTNISNIYNYGKIYGKNISLGEQGVVNNVNYGEISSDVYAIVYSGDFDSTLLNRGVVSGGSYAIYDGSNGTTFFIDNYGVIFSAATALHIDPAATVNLILEAGSTVNGAIELGGKLNVDTPDNNQLNGIITGSGALVKSGSASLILAGNNSYTGGTTVSAGTLQLGNGGTSGAITGDVLNNGMLTFDRSDTVVFAGAVSGSGSLSQIGGGALILTGSNSYTGGTTVSAGTLQLGNGGTSGSITGDVLNNGTLGFDRSDTVTFSGAVSGVGGLSQIGSGTLVLTGQNSYGGATAVRAGTLRAGSAGAFSAKSLFTVASGALLDANGFSQALAGLTNAGAVATNASTNSAGTTLTIQGNYVGQGGRLILNTTLKNGRVVSDRLIVNGNLSGSTTLILTNVNGASGRTSGDGIEMVQVNGASQAGALKLASTLSAGAYDYNLLQGGVGADAGSQNWYLRSVGYSAAAQRVLPYASSLMNIADVTLADAEARASSSTGNGWWGRFIGQYGRFDPKSGNDYSTGVSYNQDVNVFQAGFEGIASRGKAGSLSLGFYGTVGFSRVNLGLSADPLTGTARGNGRISTNIYGLGSTVSFTGHHGFYADLVGQANAYSSNLSSVSNPHNHGWSGSASFEAGQNLGLGDGWSIVPRAQVIWTHLGLDGFSDNGGNAISFADNNIVKGRAGLRLKKQAAWFSASGKERAFTFQASAHMVHEFTKGTTLDVAGSTLRQIQKRDWTEGGLSASYLRGKALNLYTEATYARAVTGGYSHALRPTVGVKAYW